MSSIRVSWGSILAEYTRCDLFNTLDPAVGSTIQTARKTLEDY